MTETPEIPEADDSFAKPIAISVAVLAVCISFIGNFGDNAKTDSILKTSSAANQWSYFQAKSIKQHAYALQVDTLSIMAPGAVDPAKRDALIASYQNKIEAYDQEKKAIGFGTKDAAGQWAEGKDADGAPVISAKQFEAEAIHDIYINDRCDLASLLLSLGVIFCSVAILMRHHAVWYAGIGIGLAGALVGATAFFM